MIAVKICGLARREDVEAALREGADAIGLNFVDGTPRAISLETGAELSALAAGRALRVGVFRDAPIERVREVVEAVRLDVVQLHGDESPAYVAALDYPVIKVLGAGDDLEARAAAYPGVELLIDHPSGGGSGRSWNYEGARALVASGRRVWLAGGLSADNVALALEAASAQGVDASSALESAPGKKHPQKVAAFIAAARAAAESDAASGSGYYGEFGGRFVPEVLVPAVQQLGEAWGALRDDASFWEELRREHRDYIGRATPLYLAERVSEDLGVRVYLKREDLAHTGAHKINNAIGQVLIAKRMGKRRIIAETGAGQHGVATATACARYGVACEVYMGEEDTRRQALNVFRMELLGAVVHPVTSGSRTLKDAMNEAMRDWSANVRTTYYCIGSVAGPHPYPMLVRDLQAVIGDEARAQIQSEIGRLPDVLMACIGGGSNAIGLFHAFRDDPGVAMIGVEAGGEGLHTSRHGAALAGGSPGVLHGSRSYVLQDDCGQIFEAHSISAGLDYPGVGPEHSYLHDVGRAEYEPVTDVEALDAFVYLSQLEGIIPAFESAHAIAALRKRAAQWSPDTVVIVNLSGRGDKDVAEAQRLLAARQ